MHLSEILAVCRHRCSTGDDAHLLDYATQVEDNPQDPYCLHRLTALCRQLGYDDLWPHAARAALALPHVTYQQIYYRGATKLALGDWSGWADRETRLFNPEERLSQSTYARKLQWAKQMWNGEDDLRDETLLLVADGFDGDCIQMLRYVPLLSSLCRQLILGVSPALFSFVQHNVGPAVTVTFKEFNHAIPFQRFAWIMSLAAIFGQQEQFVPLTAPNPATRSTRKTHRLQIGLCSTGEDRYLAPLLHRDDLQWHMLQMEDTPPDAAAYPREAQALRPFYTYANAANFISGLDCVVSTRTPIAHLAGALGVPTFLLLPCGADSRWGLGDTTPWYPSMRLLRQPAPGDWSTPIAALATELEANRPATVISGAVAR